MRDFKNPATTTISFELNDERVFAQLDDTIKLVIYPANDNLCFRLDHDGQIMSDGVDYKNASTMQATINRALRWHCLKVKLVVKPLATA
jgi:hypothetical protein